MKSSTATGANVTELATFKQPSPSTKSASDSGSESDVYGASRRRTTSKKQRRHLIQGGSDSGPVHGEVRFSTRKAAKVSNYNEDDEDMFEEDDAEMLTPNYWTTTADENIAAIDAILNHRIRQDIGIIFSPKICECSNSLQIRTLIILGETTLNIMYVNPCGIWLYRLFLPLTVVHYRSNGKARHIITLPGSIMLL